MPLNRKQLNPRQKRFVKEYLKDLNGTEAALRAGYSKVSAHSIASENLKKPEISAAIAKAQEKRGQKLDITAERVLAEIAKIAFSDMKNFATWNAEGMRVKDSEELEEGLSGCVAEMTQTESKDGGSFKFKLHDKTKALEQLAKHLGIFDIERFKHEKELAAMKNQGILDAVHALPGLILDEHEEKDD